jgi:uncharacterized protein (DUF1697 family)
VPPVPGYAAFLRGVNLGKMRRVGSRELREIFEAQGFSEVSTFRTSGNVVFTADAQPQKDLASHTERRLADELGYEVAVFLRSAKQVRAIARQEPFPRKQVEASHGKLQVAMLSSAPSKAARSEVLALATEEDRLAFGDLELYWLPSGGTRDSTLNVTTIEKILGPTTMRTKGTVELLAAKYFAG